MSTYIKELEDKVKFLQEQTDLYSGALHYTLGMLSVHDSKTTDERMDLIEREFKGINLHRGKK